jgi:hypothetical protein
LPAAAEFFLSRCPSSFSWSVFSKECAAHRYLPADPADAGWLRRRSVVQTSTGEVTYTFSNMFVDDLMADVLKLFMLSDGDAVVLFYSRGLHASTGR